MAFAKDKPSNSEKLRNLGVVIRANWEAIVESDDSFAVQAMKFTDRTAAGISLNPNTLASACQIFCKQDSSNNPELYIRNSTGAIRQLTKGGNLGTIGTNYLFDSFSHDNGTTTYNEDNFATAWGYYAAAGGGDPVAPSYGVGLGNAVRDSEGRWTISFSTALSDTNYIVIVQGNSENRRVYVSTDLQTGSFKVRCDQSWNNVSGAVPKDADFSVVVFGGR